MIKYAAILSKFLHFYESTQLFNWPQCIVSPLPIHSFKRKRFWVARSNGLLVHTWFKDSLIIFKHHLTGTEALTEVLFIICWMVYYKTSQEASTRFVLCRRWFVAVWYPSILSISFRITSLALGESYDCPRTKEANPKNMGQQTTWLFTVRIIYHNTTKNKKNCTYFMRYIVHFYSHFIFQPSFQWPVAPIKYHIISCLSISRIPFLFISCAKQPLPVNFADGTMLDVFYFRFITSSLWIPIGFVHHTGNKFRFTIMFWVCL